MKIEKIITTLIIISLIFMVATWIYIFTNMIIEDKKGIPEDVNNDGEVNALDLLRVQKYILDKKK